MGDSQQHSQEKEGIVYVPLLATPIPIEPYATWMERLLSDGQLVKYPVITELAIETLMKNGFRKSYPQPNEIAFLPPDQVDTSYLIARPLAVVPQRRPAVPLMAPPFPGQPSHNNRNRQLVNRAIPWSGANHLNSAEKRRNYQAAARGRFPKAAEIAYLEKLRKDVEAFVSSQAARTSRPSTSSSRPSTSSSRPSTSSSRPSTSSS